MSDDFALGLLAKLVENLQNEVDSLKLRVVELEEQMEMLLSDPDEDEVRFYMDGSPVN